MVHLATETASAPIGQAAVPMLPPLEGEIIDAAQPWFGRAASIICGHDFIFCRSEEDVAQFEMFVREVLQTEASDPRA